MRGSELSKAVLAGVIEQTHAGPSGRDFYSCAQLGLAINKGRFHVLTPQGRWKADRVACEVARAFGLHIITYDLGGSGRAACAKCTCGWRHFRTRVFQSYLVLLAQDVRLHLRNVETGKAPTP